MNEPIKVGDLVMVVHDCCGMRLGYIGAVERVITPRQMGFMDGHCDCGHRISGDTAMVDLPKYILPATWVKRMEPPAQDETTETHKELQA